MLHHGTGAHIKAISGHGGQVALLVFQVECPGPAPDQFHPQGQGAGINPTPLSSNRQNQLLTRLQFVQFDHPLRIVDRDRRLGDPPFHEGPEQARAISRSAATDFIGRFHEDGQPRRERIQLGKDLIDGRLRDVSFRPTRQG